MVLVLATAGLLVPALAAFAWAFLTGKLDDAAAQSVVILDEVDLRLARPWEDARAAAARAEKHGPPVEPQPGEWGGWS